MTTTRYSGNVRVRISYHDRDSEYLCTVATMDGAQRCVIRLRPPAVLRHAVDSSEAFDETAHAALSFAAEGNDWVATQAGYAPDCSGWEIKRRRDK